MADDLPIGNKKTSLNKIWTMYKSERRWCESILKLRRYKNLNGSYKKHTAVDRAKKVIGGKIYIKKYELSEVEIELNEEEETFFQQQRVLEELAK